jgi:hypothetical protein
MLDCRVGDGARFIIRATVKIGRERSSPRHYDGRVTVVIEGLMQRLMSGYRFTLCAMTCVAFGGVRKRQLDRVSECSRTLS